MDTYGTQIGAGNVGTSARAAPVVPSRLPTSDFRPLSSDLRLPTSDFRPPTSRTGMTLIELGVVMGIVTVLMALILGLSRHVNEVVKIRRAQADLGEWHETLNTWYLKYGMYPDPSAPPFNCTVESNLVWLASTDVNHQYYAPGSVPFRFSALMSRQLPTRDPWGTPYFYQSATNSYELLSCGPNRIHQMENGNPFPEEATRSNDPNTDDVYFEP